MKIYNFKNKKLYESNAVYTLSVEEFDANGNSIDKNSFEDTYSTLEDALEDSYELMTNCAAEEGYDEDDVEYVQNEDNVVFSTPDGKKWVFTASVKNNESEIVECGDMGESEKANEEIVVPNPYAGNSTTTNDAAVVANSNRDSAPRFTLNDAEIIWQWGELPKSFGEVEMDPSIVYNYFKDFMLDTLVASAPADNGRIYPDALENAMYAIVKLFTYEGRISSEFVKKAIMDLINKLNIDVKNPVYKDVIGGIEDLTESVKEQNESVAERFSKLRKMFESDEEDSEESNDSDDSNDDNSDDKEGDDKEGDEENKDDSSDEDDDETMKAVIVTVKNGDEDKCKDEMINAGIAEDDIEILDADEDAENVEIRIDVNSIMELKDYLSKKGVDLEEEIGGEIVDDSDEDNDSSDEDNDEEGKGKEDEDNFDFDNLGDLFGAGEDEE